MWLIRLLSICFSKHICSLSRNICMIYKSKNASLSSTEDFYINILQYYIKHPAIWRKDSITKWRVTSQKRKLLEIFIKPNKIFNGLLSEKQVDRQHTVSFCFIKHLLKPKGKMQTLRQSYELDSLLTKKYRRMKT